MRIALAGLFVTHHSSLITGAVAGYTATGALMSLPDRKPNETANVTYIAAVRTVLSNYDIADEVEFVSQLQKAS